jgi:hypothetical protein
MLSRCRLFYFFEPPRSLCFEKGGGGTSEDAGSGALSDDDGVAAPLPPPPPAAAPPPPPEKRFGVMLGRLLLLPLPPAPPAAAGVPPPLRAPPSPWCCCWFVDAGGVVGPVETVKPPKAAGADAAGDSPREPRLGVVALAFVAAMFV